MYLEFFGLNEKPFGLTPDPKYLFFSEKHREGLDHLLYGIHQKEGFVLISGGTGTGKTTLCRALLERLDSREVTSALILNPLLSEQELLKAILGDFGLPSGGTTRKELLDVLSRFLLKSLEVGRTAVLIIDEAQNLSIECLEQVRLLSNLETDKEKLIQIILVGSEELPAKLELPKLRHLQQRISLRYHLRPLDRQETRKYLQHRLNMARGAGSIFFEKGAYQEIYRFSRGVPRLINMIAERALMASYLAESRKIKTVHVLQGRQSLSGRVPSGRSKLFLWFSHNRHRASMAFIVVVIGSALLLLPRVQETLKRFVQNNFTRESFSPLNYSRQFVRAAIPSPESSMLTKPSRVEKKRIVLPPRVEEEPSSALVRSTAPLKPHASGQAESEVQRRDALAKAKSRGGKQRFPQYLLKPPYVYTVQVESFKDEKVAAARMRELQNRGFDAWVAWIDLGEMGIWYRVLVGRYKDKNEAQAMAHKLGQRKEFQRARQIATHQESVKDMQVEKP